MVILRCRTKNGNATNCNSYYGKRRSFSFIAVMVYRGDVHTQSEQHFLTSLCAASSGSSTSLGLRRQLRDVMVSDDVTVSRDEAKVPNFAYTF